MIDLTIIKVGDKIEFKKPHPCGGTIWLVQRIGIDFKLECEKCGRLIMIPRLDVKKRIKRVL